MAALVAILCLFRKCLSPQSSVAIVRADVVIDLTKMTGD